jgi:hypothetical protein
MWVLLSFSCGGEPKPGEGGAGTPSPLPTPKTLEQHIQEQLANGEENDTIVLDFVFGMSKRDVYKHTKKLASAKYKKMYKIEKRKGVWEYVYDLRLREAGKLRTYFEAFYHDNELYKVECLPRLKKDQVPAEVLAEILSNFEMKYGKPHFSIPDQLDENCVNHIWVDGNRQVELGCHKDKVSIYYPDLPMAAKAAKEMDM